MKQYFDLSLLYAEDDAATREEVHLLLKRRVREVFVAKNGEEGVRLYRQHRPDVTVTDIRMPVVDGLKMARSIRSLAQEAPVILMTAHSDASFMLDAIDIGVDQYVLKPVDAGKLIAAIGRCADAIESRRAEKRYHEEREALVQDLQAALARVKLLSGLLPICASCKKIRDDKGYWQQIEAYISDHSEAEFSHGICPECAKKIYSKYHISDDKL